MLYQERVDEVEGVMGESPVSTPGSIDTEFDGGDHEVETGIFFLGFPLAELLDDFEGSVSSGGYVEDVLVTRGPATRDEVAVDAVEHQLLGRNHFRSGVPAAGISGRPYSWQRVCIARPM